MSSKFDWYPWGRSPILPFRPPSRPPILLSIHDVLRWYDDWNVILPRVEIPPALVQKVSFSNPTSFLLDPS
jgi:hypothetical protein